jgi:capsular exopolysaccharide synthesis family protein
VVIAQSGLRVALIDADLHRPTVHKRFGANNNYGISTLFVQAEPDLQAVLKPTSVNGLSILTTGPLPPNPSELLGSEKMNLILKKLAELVDYIIIDSPPTTVVTDAMVLSKKVGGVLLVARPGKTPVVVLRRANEELARVEGYYYYKRRYYAYGLNPEGEKSRPLNQAKVEKKAPMVERKTSPRN